MVSTLAAWALLAGGLLGLVFTVHGFLPSRREPLLVVSFAASLLTLELAAHHLAWQIASAGVLVALGALSETAGRVGLAVSAVSSAGLALMLIEASRARGTMREALSGFGRAAEAPRIPASHLLFPFPLHRDGVRRTRDVVYAQYPGRRVKLDVYEPAAPGRGRPALVQVHGGAWVVGDKREQGIPLCLHAAAHGWVAFNVNYRLSPGATFPEHLIDLKRAIAWIREHAEDHGVDPSFLAVTGGSAGGHLTALLALTAGDLRYQPGFEEADTSVQAAVPFYGVYDFTNRSGAFPPVFVRRLLEAHVMKAFLAEEPEKFRDASPLDRVRADAPPFLVIHGGRDTLAPIGDARAFVGRLREVSRSAVLYAEIRGAQHAFDVFATPRSAPVIEGVVGFLDEARRRHLAGDARSEGSGRASRAGGGA